MPPAGRHVFYGGSHTGGLPIIFIIMYSRGRGVPRPYRAVFFLPRRAGCSTSLKCARTAGTPDLLFLIYYLLFICANRPAHASSPSYRTLSAPFPPRFVQSGQNAHFTPKNMCNILRKTPLRMGSFFGTIKLCKSAFLQVRPEQNLGKCAKRRGPVRVPPHGMQITLMKTEEEKCPEQNSLWMAIPLRRT